MYKTMKFLIGAAIPAVLLAQSSQFANLTGQFAIMGKDAIDPPPHRKSDRLGLFLTGDSAKRTYGAMTVRPIRADACEKGLRLKTAGGLVCADHGGNNYTCSVAILLSSGQTRSIAVC